MSSSHIHHISGITQFKKVEDLVRKYQKINSPSPVMKVILKSSREYTLLVGAIRRQVSLVKCRSQNFEDGQVTIYDKALLQLSKYGEAPADLGALELYLTEFLGIVPIGGLSDGKDTVASHIELHGFFTKAKGTDEISALYKRLPRDQIQMSTTDNGKSDEALQDNNPRKDHKSKDPRTSGEPGKDEGQHHDKVERMLEIYRQAKHEYFSMTDRDGPAMLNAVRFLRDTAENVLRYLHSNGLSGNACVPDLERVFAIARDKTAEVLGRKRHFDDETGRRSRKRGRRVVDSYRPQKGRR